MHIDCMTTLDPLRILHTLSTTEPVRLDDLPRDRHGIYALHDHLGAIRYIGITNGDRYGFRGRIYNRHTTGSEERSHKFAHAYNTGRMWRALKDKRPDAKLARRLRAQFARWYCRASFVVVEPSMVDQLEKIEKIVQRMAPPSCMTWGDDLSFLPVPEPSELVDALMDQFSYSKEQREAVGRQALLCARRST